MSGKDRSPLGDMSYKQWLVGMALQGLLASDPEGSLTAENCAKAALKYANAVLNELENEKPLTKTKDIL